MLPKSCNKKRKQPKSASKNSTPFGELNFIYDAIHRLGIKLWIDNPTGKSGIGAQYSYAEIALSLLANGLVQGEYLSGPLKKKLHQLLSEISSPDAVEYACKEVQTLTKTPTPFSRQGVEVKQEINYNTKRNKDSIGLWAKTKPLKSGEQGYIFYVLGYDDRSPFDNQEGEAENSSHFLLNESYQTPYITKSMRVKALCFHDIAVTSRYIAYARQKIFEVLSIPSYSLLQI